MNYMKKYSQNCFREAGAASSNLVAPTIYLIDTAAQIPHPPKGAGQCAHVHLSLPALFICPSVPPFGEVGV